MNRILVDTSALYALIDQNDSHHAEAAKILASLLPLAPQLVVPNFLLAETHTIINRRIGPREALRFLKGALLDYQIERVTVEDEHRAVAMLQRISVSRDFSYFDAVAAALAERLGIEEVFTFDRHFALLGLKPIVATR